MKRSQVGCGVGLFCLAAAVVWVDCRLRATAAKAHADIVRVYEVAKKRDYQSIRAVASNYSAGNLEWFEKDFGPVERFQFRQSEATFLPGLGRAHGTVWRRGKPYEVAASIQDDRVMHIQEYPPSERP